MERQGDTIYFNPDEQREFNLPEQVDVSVVWENILAFQDAAEKTRRNAEKMIGVDDESRELYSRESLLYRAGRLEAFAGKLLDVTVND